MKIKKKNKKGTHVGVILSFIIFVTFLVFLYSIMEPKIKIQRDKEFFLNYIEEKLIKNVSANLTIFTLSIDDNTPQNCIEIEGLMNLSEIDSRIIVKNKFEDITRANISESDNNDLLIDRFDNGNVFFKIYRSEEFEGISMATINPCGKLEKDKEEYSLGLTKIDRYIFENKIISLINTSEDFKNKLNIPAGNYFSFSFIYSNGTKIGTEEKNVSISVYAKETTIQYIDEEANINTGFINIRVW